MKEQEEAVEEQGDGAEKADEVPEELRLAYREDLSKTNGKAEENKKDDATAQKPEPAPAQSQPAQSTVAAQATSHQFLQAPVPAMRQPPAQQARRRQEEAVPAWIDKAIYGVVIALIVLFYRKLVS